MREVSCTADAIANIQAPQVLTDMVKPLRVSGSVTHTPFITKLARLCRFLHMSNPDKIGESAFLSHDCYCYVVLCV